MSANFRIINDSLSSEEQKDFAVVKSKDGVSYAVKKPLILKSNLFKRMMEDVAEGELVELPVDATKETLDRVFEFLDYHQEKPMKPIQKPIRGNFKDIVDEWDWNFFQNRLLVNGDERQNMELQLVICCANFLIIDDLRLFTCAALGSLIITKKTEAEIFDLFNARDKIKPEHWEKLYAMYPFMRPKEGEKSNE